MSSEIAIRTTHLSKAYAIFGKPEDRLKQMLMRGRRQYFREFWALRDVNMEVHRGETVGIIGSNGSGKSTLLRLICGILTQTSGEVMVRGRVAALLELGTGFNPNFTGRENVFVSGAIRGYAESEIRDRFADIESFADIGEFIDQPVKTYSSGMYARLAFAVAINVDPDILLVDEVLAVGDEAFKRKCFARIEELKAGDGTILFVSHSAKAIIELCDRAVLLHKGKRLFTGEPKEAVGYYQKLINAPEGYAEEICAEIAGRDVARSEASALPDGRAGGANSASAPGADGSWGDAAAGEFVEEAGFDPSLVSASLISFTPTGAEILDPRVLDESGRRVNCLIKGERYRFCFDALFSENSGPVSFSTVIRTRTGVQLGGGQYPGADATGLHFRAGQRALVTFEFDCALNAGTYFINCQIRHREGRSLHRINDALVFRVAGGEKAFSTGLVDFGYKPDIRIDAA